MKCNSYKFIECNGDWLGLSERETSQSARSLQHNQGQHGQDEKTQTQDGKGPGSIRCKVSPDFIPNILPITSIGIVVMIIAICCCPLLLLFLLLFNVRKHNNKWIRGNWRPRIIHETRRRGVWCGQFHCMIYSVILFLAGSFRIVRPNNPVVLLA